MPRARPLVAITPLHIAASAAAALVLFIAGAWPAPGGGLFCPDTALFAGKRDDFAAAALALEKGRSSPVALSPDGALLVYAATDGGRPRLYLRPLRELSARAIAGTDSASTPFFSPDGRWLASMRMAS